RALPRPNQRAQSHLLHEALDALVVDRHPQRIAHRRCDSSVALATFVFIVNGANLCLRAAWLGTVDRLALVVESAARKPCCPQQVRHFVVPPQSEDQARFVGATDLFARIKACTVFK
ncbi:hypothetical protein QN397_26620, partial [Variovorax sp. RTB1]